MTIKAILFDFDGTLTKPGSLDFDAIKRAIGCPRHEPILEHIRNLPAGKRRRTAQQTLARFEQEAAARSRPNTAAERTLAALRRRGLRLGILTRNSRASVDRALGNFKRTTASDFDLILTRDRRLAPKPDPAGVRYAARQWKLAPTKILVVGDYVYDIEAGQRAGAPTVLLADPARAGGPTASPDHEIRSLSELKDLLALYEPLPLGKLPNALLQKFLAETVIADPSVLVGPGVGQDAAVVRATGKELLVLKSEPITFATNAIGYYSIVVGANDLATCGATPRWFLASLLMPPGTTAAAILRTMRQLRASAARFGFTLCGGHTELTDAVRRPVIAGQLLGTVPRSRLIRKTGIRKGDAVLLTKKAAVEGTAIIARELPGLLRKAGFEPAEIRRCARFVFEPGLSVLPEAELAARSGMVTAMHDVTEGGMATAVAELAEAGGHRIRIDIDKLPVYPETRRLCRALGLNPLGLIGSGSLLICCRRPAAGTLARRLRARGIGATRIGEVLAEGAGVSAFRKGRPARWPRFAVDEIARLFQRLGTKP